MEHIIFSQIHWHTLTQADYITTTNVKGCLVYAEHRFYFIKKNKVLTGPYVSAEIKGFYYNHYNHYSNYTIELDPYLHIGFQAILSWPRNIAIDLSLGVGGFYINNYVKYHPNVGYPPSESHEFIFWPSVNFKIGYILNKN